MYKILRTYLHITEMSHRCTQISETYLHYTKHLVSPNQHLVHKQITQDSR